MEKLKERWGITSNIQIILILLVFAINGSFAAWVANPVTAFLVFLKLRQVVLSIGHYVFY